MTPSLPKTSPRPHALLITLWADGYSVYFLSPDNTWVVTLSPQWNSSSCYMIQLTGHLLISDGIETKLTPSTPETLRNLSNGPA